MSNAMINSKFACRLLEINFRYLGSLEQKYLPHTYLIRFVENFTEWRDRHLDVRASRRAVLRITVLFLVLERYQMLLLRLRHQLQLLAALKLQARYVEGADQPEHDLFADRNAASCKL